MRGGGARVSNESADIRSARAGTWPWVAEDSRQWGRQQPTGRAVVRDLAEGVGGSATVHSRLGEQPRAARERPYHRQSDRAQGHARSRGVPAPARHAPARLDRADGPPGDASEHRQYARSAHGHAQGGRKRAREEHERQYGYQHERQQHWRQRGPPVHQRWREQEQRQRGEVAKAQQRAQRQRDSEARKQREACQRIEEDSLVWIGPCKSCGKPVRCARTPEDPSALRCNNCLARRHGRGARSRTAGASGRASGHGSVQRPDSLLPLVTARAPAVPSAGKTPLLVLARGIGHASKAGPDGGMGSHDPGEPRWEWNLSMDGLSPADLMAAWEQSTRDDLQQHCHVRTEVFDGGVSKRAPFDPPLVQAAAEGRLETVKALLEAGSPVDLRRTWFARPRGVQISGRAQTEDEGKDGLVGKGKNKEDGEDDSLGGGPVTDDTDAGMLASSSERCGARHPGRTMFHGDTALIAAARHGHLHVVTHILESGGATAANLLARSVRCRQDARCGSDGLYDLDVALPATDALTACERHPHVAGVIKPIVTLLMAEEDDDVKFERAWSPETAADNKARAAEMAGHVVDLCAPDPPSELAEESAPQSLEVQANDLDEHDEAEVRAAAKSVLSDASLLAPLVVKATAHLLDSEAPASSGLLSHAGAQRVVEDEVAAFLRENSNRRVDSVQDVPRTAKSQEQEQIAPGAASDSIGRTQSAGGLGTKRTLAKALLSTWSHAEAFTIGVCVSSAIDQARAEGSCTRPAEWEPVKWQRIADELPRRSWDEVYAAWDALEVEANANATSAELGGGDQG